MRAVLLALSLLVSAAAPSPVASGSQLSYSGSAPLHNWTGTSKAVTGSLDLHLDAPAQSTVRLSAPVSSFDSGNGARDRKMLETTEAARFPTVAFVSTSVSPTQWTGAPGHRKGRWAVQGTVTFHGVSKPVNAVVDVVERGGVVTASPAFSIHMTDFGVERPSIGPLKVSDTLSFHGTIRTLIASA